jgi:hypothetical protein
VTVLPAQDPDVITPLFTITPDKLEGTEVVRNKLPPIPTPPATVSEPVDDEVETVVDVTANPGVERIKVEGLKDIALFEERAIPEPDILGENIKECAELANAVLTFMLDDVVAKPEVFAYPALYA